VDGWLRRNGMGDGNSRGRVVVIGRVETPSGWHSYALLYNPGEAPALSIRAERRDGTTTGRLYLRRPADIDMLKAGLAALEAEP
jgi:hypothetical protein